MNDAASLPTTPGGWAVILADPPWSFRAWSSKGNDRAPDAMVRGNGLAERHYKTMTLADIKELPVGDVAAKTSALFLWAVDCMLPDAIEVGEGWGFRFKTVAFTWIKQTKHDGFRRREDGTIVKNSPWHIGLGY